MSSYLIKGGHVLLFDDQRKSSFPQLDILVEGQRISMIGTNLATDLERSVEVVDASGCIVTPGFIDGHRHVFQSQLRSTVGNHTLLEYCAHLLQGRMIFFDEDDIYLSQLSGLAEAIHSGVTTVVSPSLFRSPCQARNSRLTCTPVLTSHRWTTPTQSLQWDVQDNASKPQSSRA